MTTRRISDLAATHVTVSARDENTGEELSIQLPIVRGSAGAPAVDISTLPAATGLYTLDPGFVATGSCRSAITFIDGPAGVLLHRGYGIDDLAARLPAARVKEFPTASHSIHNTNADEFVADLCAIVDRCR